MSTIPTGYTPANDHFSLAPTQPLPLIVPSMPRPFVVARVTQPVRVRPIVRPKVAGRLLPLWLAVFALLNLGDILSTYIGLSSGMREGNPLMSSLLAHYGFGALIVYKVLVVVAVTAGVLLLRTFQLKIARITIAVCNILVLLVVAMNVIQFVLS